MNTQTIETSPQSYARVGGVLYLLIIAFGFFAEGYVNHRLIVSGDAAATAQNIAAHPLLWRVSLAVNVLVALFAVPLTWIVYLLLRPVNRELALLAVLFNVICLSVEVVSKLYLFEAASLLKAAGMFGTLGAPGALGAFDPPQWQALAYEALKAHDRAFDLALLFFGCECVLNGLLIFRSGYFPRVIGILMLAAGASYLTACGSALFMPALAKLILPAALLPALIGELSLCLWLLLKGVDLPKWDARVRGGYVAA
jgi:Domain of unknown function (DUF4386)